MGKSSFLRYLSSTEVWQKNNLDPATALVVRFNCTDVNPFTPDAFLREILRLLRDEVEDDPLLQAKIEPILQQEMVEKGDLRRILRQIGQHNKSLLLLLDDYDAILRPNAHCTEVELLTFLTEFRNLAVHSDEGEFLSTVVTSYQRLSELGPHLTPSGSPWYNHYKFLLLKPLKSQEADELLSLPVSATLKREIIKMTGRHPALLQCAGDLLYNISQSQETPDAEVFFQAFVSATKHIFQDTWRFASPIERMPMMLIALSRLEGHLNRQRRYDLGDLDLIFSQRDRELLDLQERGIIQSHLHNGRPAYSFSSSVMDWWVIQEIENSNEAQLEQLEKVFLNLSRAQVERIRTAIRQVWQHKDAITAFSGWVGGLVGAFAKGFKR